MSENKFRNGKIYKIVNNEDDLVYVGSTTLDLKKRFQNHKYNFKKHKKTTNTYLLFEKYGIENCEIVLIENLHYKEKNDLFKLEGKYIKELNSINKNIAGRDDAEYYKDNKKKLLDITRLYYQQNKESLTEQKKQKYECETCGGKYTHVNKSRHLKSKKHLKHI